MWFLAAVWMYVCVSNFRLFKPRLINDLRYRYKICTPVELSQPFNRNYFLDNRRPFCDFMGFWSVWKMSAVALHWEKIPIKITVLAQYSCSIFTHTHARENLVFDNLLYTEFYTVYSILFCIQYEINRKMKMLQEYWGSTVIFIGIFSHCGFDPRIQSCHG